MGKHTPGPWRVPGANVFRVLAVNEDGTARRLIYDGGPDGYWGRQELKWDEDSGPEQAANAALIARAPDMDAEIARLRERVAELEGLLLLVVKQALGTGPQEPTDAELIDLTNRIMGALAQPAPGGAREIERGKPLPMPEDE